MTLALPKPQYKKERKAKKRAKETGLQKNFRKVLKLDADPETGKCRCWNPFCFCVAGKYEECLHPEHVYPRGRGRDDSVNNLAAACDMCNGHTTNGSILYGGKKSGDEVKLMILEAIKDKPGFRFDKQLSYFRENVERKKGRKV